MDNEFDENNNQLVKGNFVDVRIVLTDLDYIEYVSKAISNFDLSNFNVIVSSIIPTKDYKLAKTAINGADLVLVAVQNNSEGLKTFNILKKALKTDYNFIEVLNLPVLEKLNNYEENIFEDEIANSIIRGGLFSISNLSSINNAKFNYYKLKEAYDNNLLKLDKLNQENIHLLEESRHLRSKNEKLTEEIKILQKDLDTIKSDFSDFKSRLESMYVRNSLEVFPIVDLWNELFAESFNEDIYKFILVVTDSFRPKNIMIGQGIVCAESKEEALDWLKVIKTASILVDENINDLNFTNFSSNLNFDNFDKLADYQSKLESDNFDPVFESDNLKSFESDRFSPIEYDNPLKSDDFVDSSFEEDIGNSYNPFLQEESQNVSNDHFLDSDDEEFREVDFDEDFENSKADSPYDGINVFKLNSLRKDDDEDSDLNLDDYNDYDYDEDIDNGEESKEEDSSVFPSFWD